MPIDVRLLTLMQWLSPGFPISSFAYSHGLESAIAEGHINDAKGLREWLEGVLIHGTGRTDAIWVRLAYDAAHADALRQLNEHAIAFMPARERRAEAEKQGRAFVQTVNAVWTCTLPDLILPLAAGAAARRKEIDIDLVVPLYLQSFLANLVSASQRLMPFGQTEAQKLLSQMHSDTLSVARNSRDATLDDIHGMAYVSDIMAMRHETLSSRLFHS